MCAVRQHQQDVVILYWSLLPCDAWVHIYRYFGIPMAVIEMEAFISIYV